MKTYRKIILARGILALVIFSLLLAWVLTSCEQHDLCYDHNHSGKVNIYYTWEVVGEEKPTSMFLFLFPDRKDKVVIKREFAGNEEGRTVIENGVAYDALTFNSDRRNLVVENAFSRDSLFLSTTEATMIDRIGLPVSEMPKSRGAEGQRFLSEADRVFVDASKEKIFTDYFAGDGQDIEMHIPFSPKRVSCVYNIKVKEVLNPTKVASGIAASISGLSSGIYPWSGKKGTEKVNVPFAADLDVEKGVLDATMTCFGRVEDDSVKNILTIYTTLKDGSKFTFVFDITDLIRNAADPYNVSVVLDRLPVPDVIDPSGMKPSIDKWEAEDIPIKM